MNSLNHIYWMRNAKTLISLSIMLAAVPGCATRDNADFQAFHTQTAILALETAATQESALFLAEMNLVEAISDGYGDGELLEFLVLQRKDPFTLQTDSTSILSVLSRAKRELDEAAIAISLYSMLLAEISEKQVIALELSALAEPFAGVLSSAIAVLIEQGTVEHDAEKTLLAMQTAAPAVESLSEAMSALTLATANAVQATYTDMAARRQRNIIEEGYPEEAVMELVVLNRQVTILLRNLQAVHDSWITVPVIHTELMNSLTEASISSTLRILTERLSEIRGEEQ